MNIAWGNDQWENLNGRHNIPLNLQGKKHVIKLETLVGGSMFQTDLCGMPVSAAVFERIVVEVVSKELVFGKVLFVQFMLLPIHLHESWDHLM